MLLWWEYWFRSILSITPIPAVTDSAHICDSVIHFHGLCLWLLIKFATVTHSYYVCPNTAWFGEKIFELQSLFPMRMWLVEQNRINLPPPISKFSVCSSCFIVSGPGQVQGVVIVMSFCTGSATHDPVRWMGRLRHPSLSHQPCAES